MKKAMLIVGILGFLLCGAVAIFFMVLPTFSHTDMQEAMMGIVPSCFCTFVFFVIAIIGFVLVMKAKKKAKEGGPSGM